MLQLGNCDNVINRSKYQQDSRFGTTDMSNGKASALTSAALSQATDTTLVMSDMSEVSEMDANKPDTPLGRCKHLVAYLTSQLKFFPPYNPYCGQK